jgi:hypothetical protein
MLQTSILRTVLIGPPKLAPAAAWQRCRGLLLTQITAIVGMLALVCGLLWAVTEYEEHRADLRRAETNRYLDQFRSGSVGAAWARLSATWQAERPRQDALLAGIASSGASEHAQRMRNHGMFVIEIIEEYGLHDEIHEVSRFVARLAICVRAGSCDANVVAAQLGPTLWAFRDQHEYYFRFEYAGQDVDEYLRIIAPRPQRQWSFAARHW